MIGNQKFDIKCSQIEHGERMITALCLSRECFQPRAICSQCMIQTHRRCSESLVFVNDLPQYVTQRMNEFEMGFSILGLLIQRLKSIQKQLQENLNFIELYKNQPNLANLNKISQIFLDQRVDLDSMVTGNELISQFIENYLNPSKAKEVPDQQRIEAEQWQEKGQLYFETQYFLKAIECYNKALSINPKFASLWNDKGLALIQVYQIQEAIKCYDEAIKIDPNDYNFFNNKGSALHQLNLFQEAILCYEKSIDIKPTYFVYYNKSESLICLNQLQEAMICLKKALELNPNYEKAIKKLKIISKQ